MSKLTSPPANAVLPAIDRRSLVCGIGTAAVAGVPVTAGAVPMSDDPVFQAMATTPWPYATPLISLRGARRHEQEARKTETQKHRAEEHRPKKNAAFPAR